MMKNSQLLFIFFYHYENKIVPSLFWIAVPLSEESKLLTVDNFSRLIGCLSIADLPCLKEVNLVVLLENYKSVKISIWTFN